MAISVRPAASQARTASAIGADTATMTGTPMAAAFCTISIETRLLSMEDRESGAMTARPEIKLIATAAVTRSEIEPDHKG